MPAQPAGPASGAGAVRVGGAATARREPTQTGGCTGSAGQLGVGLPTPAAARGCPRQQGNSALDFPREQRLAIRNWARDNGYDVADRGALSQEVLAAYREASEEHKEAR